MHLKGIGALFLVGLSFAFAGILMNILNESTSPYKATELGFLGALFILFFFSIITRNKLSLPKNKALLATYSVAFPFCLLFFALSIYNGSVALAIASTYGATLILSFALGRIFFKEKIGLYKIAALLLSIIALIVFTNPLEDFSLSLGLLFGLFAGFMQAIFFLCQKKLEGSDKISLLLFQSCVGLLISLTVVSFAGEDPVSIPTQTLLPAFLYGSTFLSAVWLLFYGLRYIPLNTGSIIISSELVFGPFLAWILLSEKIGWNIIFGIGLLLAAAFLAHWKDSELKK